MRAALDDKIKPVEKIFEVKRMTLPFKAVAVDMDGTFLDDRKQFDHEQFDQLLTEFEKRGVHFIVASGRPYVRLKQDFKGFADRMDFVTLNGSRLIIKVRTPQVTQ